MTLLRRSLDGGRTWGEPWQPFDDVAGGIKGSLQVVYITAIDAGKLIAAGCWVNREAFPGKPLFNPESEGCLPMDILVAESNGSRQILDAMAQDSTSRRCGAG